MKTTIKANRGFTLVELLLVIAIIGILAAVLFISLGKQRQRARITAFKEQMRTLLPNMTTCVDNGGVLLTPNGTGGDICSLGSHHGTFLHNDYMKDCTINGTGSYTITRPSPNDYRGTCPLGGGAPDCVADCTFNGCTFTNCN